MKCICRACRGGTRQCIATSIYIRPMRHLRVGSHSHTQGHYLAACRRRRCPWSWQSRRCDRRAPAAAAVSRARIASLPPPPARCLRNSHAYYIREAVSKQYGGLRRHSVPYGQPWLPYGSSGLGHYDMHAANIRMDRMSVPERAAGRGKPAPWGGRRSMDTCTARTKASKQVQQRFPAQRSPNRHRRGECEHA